MTDQEFKQIYKRFAKDEKDIRLKDTIKIDGYLLKEFLELAIQLTAYQRTGS